MKAVFDTKPASGYDDDLSQHYQFPKRYLKTVEESVGDWVVLRRPRADGGSMGYFAVAHVAQIEPAGEPSLHYARLTKILTFDTVVPWTKADRYWEDSLRNVPQQQVGVFLRGKSVRPLSEEDFAAITKEGLRKVLEPANAGRLQIPLSLIGEAQESLRQPPAGERNWRIDQVLTNKVIRDASFKSNVYDAYDNRCAVTRLQILEAGGLSEVHAAHIWSVAEGGPDVVQNGIALCATAHWLFDHYLISVDDEYRILIDDQRVPLELRSWFERFDRRILLPSDRREWPHQAYLEWHRTRFRSNGSC